MSPQELEPENENWLGNSALFAIITGFVAAFRFHAIRWPWNLLIPIFAFIFQFGWSYGSYCLSDWISHSVELWQMPPWIKRIDAEMQKPFSWRVIWLGPIYIIVWIVMVGAGRAFSFCPLFLVLLLQDSQFK